MYHKLTSILKLRTNPFVLLVACLITITLLTTLSGIWNHQYELDHASKPSTGVTVKNKSDQLSDTSTTSSPTNNLLKTGQTDETDKNASTSPTVLSANTTSAVDPDSQPIAPSSTTVEATLSINGAYKGKVTLLNTSNQCNVLSQALSDGLISSLDMRYYSQYNTYGVYIIDGTGDSGTIWWTYTVNGRSPPYGCSGTKVNNGDSVNWQYVKK